jgi:hypothetical protein
MDEERLRRKQEELRKRREGGGSKDFWNPKPGPNKIRILPNWTKDSTADFFYETNYHKSLGPDKKKTCTCPKAEGYDYCPICDKAKELFATKDEEDAAYAKEIYKKVKVFWNIVDMDAYYEVVKYNKEHPDKPKEQKGVQVMTTGSGVLDDVIGYCLNPEYGDMTDPMKGRNITLVFTEKEKSRSGWNEYTVQPSPDRTPIEDPDWLDKMVDLKKFVKVLPAEEMLVLLYGADEDVDKSFEEKQPEKAAEQPKAEQPKAETDTGKSYKPCGPHYGKAKFDSMDVECLSCVEKDPCMEARRAKTAPKQEPEPKVEAKVEEPKKTAESSIEEKLAKIKEKMAKK